MGIRRAALAAVVALATTLTPAVSYDGPGCGGPWPLEDGQAGENPCGFRVGGLPVTVRGSTIASPNQNSSLRVWISPVGRPEVSLLECSIQGKGSLSCDAGLVDQTTRTPLPPEAYWAYLLPLECRAQVVPKGDFYCSAGVNRPWPCTPLPACILPDA